MQNLFGRLVEQVKRRRAGGLAGAAGAGIGAGLKALPTGSSEAAGTSSDQQVDAAKAPTPDSNHGNAPAPASAAARSRGAAGPVGSEKDVAAAGEEVVAGASVLQGPPLPGRAGRWRVLFSTVANM